MTESKYPVHPPISRLQLRVTFPADGRDSPTLTILIDGVELDQLTGSKAGFLGFPPDRMLGKPVPVPSPSGEWVDPPLEHASPLLQGTTARRVALYTCSCGEAGCGVIAPIIATDGAVVTWSDFRDYTGVFSNPNDPVGDAEGRGHDMGQLRFDAHQYGEEVARAVDDRSWESHSRITARIIRAMLLEQQELIETSGWRVGWVSFVSWEGGAGQFAISLWCASKVRAHPKQYVLRLTAKYGTPTSRARSIVDRLLAVPVEQWYTRFHYHRS